MYKRKIASGAAGSTVPQRPRRLAALCGAAIAAALFTPVPATANIGAKQVAPHIAVSAPEPVEADLPIVRFAAAPATVPTKSVPARAVATHAISTGTAPSTAVAPATAVEASSQRTSSITSATRSEVLAQSLISTGMVGIGLALGGIVIVTYRRRQW
jgi:hypothetical protein